MTPIDRIQRALESAGWLNCDPEDWEAVKADAERYWQVRAYYWFQREVAHRFCLSEPSSALDIDAGLDRARGVK